MTVAAYYAKHQVEGRAFVKGRAGCWFTRDRCAVVTADQGYHYCTATGHILALRGAAPVWRFIAASRSAGRERVRTTW